MKSLSKLFRIGLGPSSSHTIAPSIAASCFKRFLDENEPTYKCDCSKERTINILSSLSKKELEEMASEQEKTEVCCQFCGKKYVFTPSELRAIKK